MEELGPPGRGRLRHHAGCAQHRSRQYLWVPAAQLLLMIFWVVASTQVVTAVHVGLSGGTCATSPSQHRLWRPMACGFIHIDRLGGPAHLLSTDRAALGPCRRAVVERTVVPAIRPAFSCRLMVKQVPEDDPLVQEGLTPPPEPLLPESMWGPAAAVATVLLVGGMGLYMLTPHSASSPTGAELQVALDHLSHELSSRLVPPGYHFYQSLLSGAFAGISRGISRLATFPLDTVKTRQQAVLNQEVSADKLEAKAKKVNTKNLFDGILPMLLIAGPANAAFFVTHDYVLAAVKAVSAFPKSAMWVVELSASLLASLPANAIRIPAEVTKQRVQAGVEKTALAATVSILKEEGFTGLYVGGKAHLLRELPFNALQFLTFDSLKSLLLSEGIKVGTGQKALLGAIAAGVAGLGTQPFDVIKTLEMIDKNRSVVSKESWLATTARIYNTYGVSGLYLGLTPRLLLCSVGGAFYFLASEAVKGFYAAQMGGGPV